MVLMCDACLHKEGLSVLKHCMVSIMKFVALKYLHTELAYEYLLQLVMHLTMLFIHSIFCEGLLSQ